MPEINPLTLNKLLHFKMFKDETKSTCIADVQYEPTTREMLVQFVERGTYKYHDVPIEDYVDFETAGSQGKYFNLYIRDKFSYERVA